jgi:hypothetical protein
MQGCAAMIVHGYDTHTLVGVTESVKGIATYSEV